MFKFDVERWVPQFILRDKNGYALSRAIEAGVQMMNDTVKAAFRSAFDYDAMPEWRLDELAWETNCLYDYSADVEKKRRWIRNSVPLYRLYGTPAAIYQYLSGYFDDIDLEEYWEYAGEPFHFRVTVEGEWDPANEAWARHAIEVAKNVRSVLDGLRIGTKCRIGICAEGRMLARFTYPLTGAENWAGRWPEINILAVRDESGKMAAQAEATGRPLPYPMTGTRPEINTLGAMGEARAGFSGEAAGRKFGYPLTGKEARTGTVPEINTLGVLHEAKTAATAEATGRPLPYPMAGTRPEINTLGVLQEAKASITGEATGRALPYPMAGTQPEINTLGIPGENDIHAAQADDVYKPIYYKMCGEDEI